ncbi:MAG: hydroxymethylbutenyl pyrophosphate reductase [Thermoleophilia bacterium]|nr:hydroxymethylbutenyl pyrophosphate reductase [Thermoleophilia bacterium]
MPDACDTSHMSEPTPHRTLLLASPRGWCAGVERAVDAVEQVLELHGAPIYVRKQIVHNIHVVRDLEAKGAIFVEELDEVPRGSVVVYSAHGVSPAVRAEADQLGLRVVDATCPLVTKVHMQAVRYARDGFTIVFIGHAGHEEVEGTMGEAPDHMVLVQDEADVDRLEIGQPERLVYLTQTTLSVSETAGIIRRLKECYPQIQGPAKEDICYATSNRQAAVQDMVGEIDVLLVIGSANSSNTVRLADLAEQMGRPAYRIDDETEIDEAWVAGATTVGITSGASAPESLVTRVCDWFRDRGPVSVRPFAEVQEGVRYMPPTELRIALAEAAATRG